MANCVIEADDTGISVGKTDKNRLDDYVLGECIIKAIKAYDAANPPTASGSTLTERVAKGLQEK